MQEVVDSVCSCCYYTGLKADTGRVGYIVCLLNSMHAYVFVITIKLYLKEKGHLIDFQSLSCSYNALLCQRRWQKLIYSFTNKNLHLATDHFHQVEIVS